VHSRPPTVIAARAVSPYPPMQRVRRIVDGKQRQQTGSSSHIHTFVEVKSGSYPSHTARVDDYGRCPCDIRLCRGRTEKFAEAEHGITYLVSSSLSFFFLFLSLRFVYASICCLSSGFWSRPEKGGGGVGGEKVQSDFNCQYWLYFLNTCTAFLLLLCTLSQML